MNAKVAAFTVSEMSADCIHTARNTFDWTDSCADAESFVRGGPTLTKFFFVVVLLVNEGR